jgi:uncharacterized protein (DUF488 family)
MIEPIVFTIGHSTHEPEVFFDLLKANFVNCVIDVRSVPFSARAPQFIKEALKEYLEERSVTYLHFPKAFGARQKDPKLLDETGRVDFDKVRQSHYFKEGIDKLRHGLERGFTIALMCSEANPLDCHRFGMISYQLVREGLSVKHILRNGRLLDNEELEKMLLEKYVRKVHERSLFDRASNTETSLEIAYKLRNKEIGFIASEVAWK